VEGDLQHAMHKRRGDRCIRPLDHVGDQSEELRLLRHCGDVRVGQPPKQNAEELRRENVSGSVDCEEERERRQTRRQCAPDAKL
jgi:hypothetical protein